MHTCVCALDMAVRWVGTVSMAVPRGRHLFTCDVMLWM